MIISLLIITILLLVFNNIYLTDVDSSNFTKEVFETKITRDDYGQFNFYKSGNRKRAVSEVLDYKLAASNPQLYLSLVIYKDCYYGLSEDYDLTIYESSKWVKTYNIVKNWME